MLENMNQEEYIICIPTYQRPDILVSKTLKTLQDCNIEPRKIYIFVASSQQAVEYRKIVPKHTYNQIIIGKKGITSQRNFIRSYFPEGTNIVSIDDDIDAFYKLDTISSISTDKCTLDIFTSLDDLCKKAFHLCKEHGVKLWGIYPVKNIFYMNSSISYDLKFILGTFYGFVNNHDPDLYVSLPEKEDYEMTIKHFLKDGNVIRFNDICIKTKFHNQKGGISAIANKTERFQINQECANALRKKYPDFGYIRHRKNGMAEFKFYPKKVYEAKLRRANRL